MKYPLNTLLTTISALITCTYAFAETIQPNPTPAPKATSQFDAQLLYGQSNRFWEVVEAITSKSKPTSELLDVIDSVYNDPREGIASAKLRFTDTIDPKATPILDMNTGYVEAAGDYLAGGEIKNRVLPEYRGYTVYSGSARFGLLHRDPDDDIESGVKWEAQIGSVLGGGRATLIQAEYDELFPQTPKKQATLLYSGLDLGFSLNVRYSEFLKTSHSILLAPTYFHSSLKYSTPVVQLGKDTVALRWKTINESALTLISLDALQLNASLMATAGQQPIPVDVLPRTWDYVHGLKPLNALGSMIGAGSGVELSWLENLGHVKVTGGYFGGYLGAGAELKLWSVLLSAGTWGVEQSSSFQMSESRLSFASARFVYDF